MTSMREDLASLAEFFDMVQMTREGLSRASLNPHFGLHTRLLNLGYEERDPVVCTYGSEYNSPDKILASDGKSRVLPIMLPAELVPGSKARDLLDRSDRSKMEVYAVYSQRE